MRKPKEGTTSQSRCSIKPPASLTDLRIQKAVKEDLIKATLLVQLQGIPAFRDFTIRDPRYFVILFQASIRDFERKNQKKKKKSEIFFGFFLDFFLQNHEICPETESRNSGDHEL